MTAPCGAEPCGGGAEGARTPDLRIANATLSRLSYGPPFQGGAAPGRRPVSGVMGLRPPVCQGPSGPHVCAGGAFSP